MHKPFYAFCIGITLLFSLSWALQARPQQQTSLAANVGSILGTVTDEQGKPLAGIYVALYRQDATGQWQESEPYALTDGSGHYTATSVAASSYRIGFFSAVMPNIIPLYYTQYYSGVARLEDSAAVVVTAGQTTNEINARLAAKGKIQGTVTDQAGHPLGGIYLDILWSPNNNDEWRSPLWFNPKYTPSTDATGNYELPGLDAGAYRMGFRDWISPGFQLAYYDNAATFDLAQRIMITKGAVITGVNARLTGPLEGISGKVTDQAGSPLAKITVTALSNGAGTPEFFSNRATTTNAAGEYVITGLYAGPYYVLFTDNASSPEKKAWTSVYYPNGSAMVSAANVMVEPGKVTPGIDVALSPIGRIKGRVVDTAGNPLNGISVMIYYPFANGWGHFVGLTTAADGQFSYPLDDGEYRVGFHDVRPAQQYRGVHYPNAATVESAATLTVRAGVIVTTDAQLIPLTALQERVFLPTVQN